MNLIEEHNKKYAFFKEIQVLQCKFIVNITLVY